eukprot:TRINITY_DN24246_c0_g1_i2.p1 TRINITY_DN24246_c0_g1~~TRINITY_DN24246_c0_g1_i2.p1  ORF type:complete len:252 (+),score=52.16 TRINITY_DN24246_c0_g1_i2:58-756(+)
MAVLLKDALSAIMEGTVRGGANRQVAAAVAASLLRTVGTMRLGSDFDEFAEVAVSQVAAEAAPAANVAKHGGSRKKVRKQIVLDELVASSTDQATYGKQTSKTCDDSDEPPLAADLPEGGPENKALNIEASTSKAADVKIFPVSVKLKSNSHVHFYHRPFDDTYDASLYKADGFRIAAHEQLHCEVLEVDEATSSVKVASIPDKKQGPFWIRVSVLDCSSVQQLMALRPDSY